MRRKTVRQSGQALLYVVLAASLIACDRQQNTGQPGRETPDKPPVAFIAGDANLPQWPGITGGAQRYVRGGSALSVTVYTPPQPTEPPTLQRESVERALVDQAAAVCLFITEADLAQPENAAECIGVAHLANVLVITIGEAFEDDRVYGHVGVSQPALAEALGEDLRAVAQGQRSYLLAHAAQHSDSHADCWRRFQAAADTHSEPILLKAAGAPGEYADGRAAVEGLLGLFSQAGLLVTLRADVWLTASEEWLAALRELNEGFRFATLSSVPKLWHYLGTPDDPGPAAALVGPLHGDIGHAAIRMASSPLLTEERAAFPTVWVEFETITADTLADFAHRYSESANGLDVQAFMPAGMSPTTEPAGE